MTDNGEVQIPSVKEEAKPSKIKKPAASDNPGTEEPKPKPEEPKPKQEEPKPKQEEPKPKPEEPKPKPEEPKPEEPKPEVEILEFHHDPIENARRKKLYDDYWNGSAPHPTDTRRPWEYINGWFR